MRQLSQPTVELVASYGCQDVAGKFPLLASTILSMYWYGWYKSTVDGLGYPGISCVPQTDIVAGTFFLYVYME